MRNCTEVLTLAARATLAAASFLVLGLSAKANPQATATRTVFPSVSQEAHDATVEVAGRYVINGTASSPISLTLKPEHTFAPDIEFPAQKYGTAGVTGHHFEGAWTLKKHVIHFTRWPQDIRKMLGLLIEDRPIAIGCCLSNSERLFKTSLYLCYCVLEPQYGRSRLVTTVHPILLWRKLPPVQ